MNQACDAYHNLVQAVCKGVFEFALAAAIKHERCRPARTFKLIVQTLGRFVRWIMMSWHYAFPGITQCVTSNPFWYFNFVFICDVVVISSCHAPLTHAAWFIFLLSFTFAMKHLQVKWCISSDAQNTKNTLLLVYSNFFVSFLHDLASWPRNIPRPCFSPAFCGKLATIAFMSGILQTSPKAVPTVPPISIHGAPSTPNMLGVHRHPT